MKKSNVQQMRTALTEAACVLEEILKALRGGKAGVPKCIVCDTLQDVNAALALPLRNCDVGTTPEQDPAWRAAR